MISIRSGSRLALVALSILALAWEGFWLAGANFFSDGRDSAVQAAIVVWWLTFGAACLLSRWPLLVCVTFTFNLVARMLWAWPHNLRPASLYFFVFLGSPDAIVIVVAALASRRKS